MKIVIEGKLTAGYYNAMEADCPVFIDDEPVDERIKKALRSLGMSDEFCFGPNESESDVKNPLIGRTVRLTVEIGDA